MNEQYTGRIVMELRQDVVPMTAGRFSIEGTAVVR